MPQCRRAWALVLAPTLSVIGPPAWADPAGPGSLDFRLGQALFERTWVAAPASTDSADGLGPLYNARSCAGCHPGGGRGRAWGPDGGPGPALVLHLGLPPADSAQSRPRPEPHYGSQLQPLALPGQTAEGRLVLAWSETRVQLPDGTQVALRRPTPSIGDPGYGPLDPQALRSLRLAPTLTGLGDLEAIPEAQILAQADPQDSNGDGISGRANRVPTPAPAAPAPGGPALGRFGWKAGQPRLAGQVDLAFALDLGLSNPSHPQATGDCTPSQTACLAAPGGASPRHGGFEVGPEVAALVAGYVRALPAPPRRDPEDPRVQDGGASFRALGCGACHSPDLGPGGLYTDLLLHDLGEGLADGWTEGEASGSEWRTVPLRGLGATATGAWLHDGRARTMLEAILWHGGEAQASRDAVIALSTYSRANLLRFLESL